MVAVGRLLSLGCEIDSQKSLQRCTKKHLAMVLVTNSLPAVCMENADFSENTNYLLSISETLKECSPFPV